MPYISDRLIVLGLLLSAVLSGAAQAEEHVNVVEGDVLTGPTMMQRGIGVRSGLQLWEDGIVPYYFDDGLQPGVVAVVKTAINTWNELAGISLIEIDPQTSGSPGDYLHFVPAKGCASWIGRQGGAQSIWTAPSCSSGSMMHEIGHALGLEHEHTRPDRNQYININWQNVTHEKVANFSISKADKQYYGSYDYASIMHYGEYFFSANGKRTIVALQETDAPIGQRDAPSTGDIAAIAMLYGSDVSLVSSVVHTRAQSEVSLLVTNEYSQGANNLEIEMNIAGAQLVSSNNKQWHCSSRAGILTCQLDRLPGSAVSSLVLVLDQVVGESELQPTLLSKTPDDNLVNNMAQFSPAAAQAASTPGNNVAFSDGYSSGGAGSKSVWFLGLLGLMLAFRRHPA